MYIQEKWEYVCVGFDWLDQSENQKKSLRKMAEEEFTFLLKMQREIRMPSEKI